MALELAKHNPVYEDIASKFFEVNIVAFDELLIDGTSISSLSQKR